MDKGKKTSPKAKETPKPKTSPVKETKKVEPKKATPATEKKAAEKPAAKPATKPATKPAAKPAAKPEKKTEKKVEKKDTKKVEKKDAKKDVKKVEKKVEKKDEKKDTKKVEKKDTKKDDKKDTKKEVKKDDKKDTKKVEKKDTKKDNKKEAKKDTKKDAKKDAKKTTKVASAKATKAGKHGRTLADRLRHLPKNAAHAKRLKILRCKRYIKFTIDCSQQAQDHIMKPKELEQYLKNKIKVKGKTHNFGKKLKTKLRKNKVIVLARPQFSKRYLKYLSRRFLKKQSLRDWVRVIASGRNSYKLSYYKIESPEEEVEA